MEGRKERGRRDRDGKGWGGETEREGGEGERGGECAWVVG